MRLAVFMWISKAVAAMMGRMNFGAIQLCRRRPHSVPRDCMSPVVTEVRLNGHDCVPADELERDVGRHSSPRDPGG